MGYDVLTFGESMLRLTPPGFLRIEQTRSFDVWVGGTESNTAVGLARLGLKAAWLSRLPASPLGRYISNRIAQYGVDVRHVVWAPDEGERLGIYFHEKAPPPRPSEILYDRRDSAMSRMQPADLPAVFLHAAVTSGAILLIIGTATAFAAIASLSQVPVHLSKFLFGITSDPLLLLFFINVLLLIVGMFLDAGPAILILGPILAPTMASLGIDPLHFAVIMCINLTIGLATPPMGLILFVASGISRLRVEVIALEMLPLLAVEILAIFIVTYFPFVSMSLPYWLGFTRNAPGFFM